MMEAGARVLLCAQCDGEAVTRVKPGKRALAAARASGTPVHARLHLRRQAHTAPAALYLSGRPGTRTLNCVPCQTSGKKRLALWGTTRH